VDAAFFGSFSFVVMNSKLDIDPIGRPLKKNGTSTYKGLIFALSGKGITEDVRTWQDKRIALVHRSTMAGYIFPRYYLNLKGVKDFEGYFRKVIYVGSHDAAILSVFTGDADIGCASDRLFNKLTEENPLMLQKLLVLASSTSVPSNTLGLRKGINNALRERLKAALMTMESAPEGKNALSALGAVRFIETKKSEFEPIFEMLNTLGLKPETFALETIGREAKTDTRRIKAKQ
jgi:phosphonate transport system substrate-binding protein